MGGFGNDMDKVITVLFGLAIVGALSLVGALIWAIFALLF